MLNESYKKKVRLEIDAATKCERIDSVWSAKAHIEKALKALGRYNINIEMPVPIQRPNEDGTGMYVSNVTYNLALNGNEKFVSTCVGFVKQSDEGCWSFAEGFPRDFWIPKDKKKEG